MKNTTIFITYNPGSELEETLAARLHTIGAVNGFTMFLPDRYTSETEISNETKARISRSNYFIIFSTKALSPVVKSEIQFAFSYFNDKSRILVIYDKDKGKNLTGDLVNYFTPFYFNRVDNRQDRLLENILNTIAHKEKDAQLAVKEEQIKTLKQKNTESNALAALLGIGLGLLVLGVLLDEK